MELFYKILNDMFTGKDNETVDVARVLWVLSVLVYLILSIVEVFLIHNFQSKDFSFGLSTLFAAGCVGISIKKNTEPE